MSDVPTVQQGAVIRLGLDAGSATDFTCAITSFVINEQRTLTRKSPSFGSPAWEDKASAKQATVTITFANNPHATSGLLALMWSAQQLQTGELYFEVRYAEGSVSTSNPKRTGFIVVADLDWGTQAFQVRQSTKTFPARAISDPIAA